MIKKSFCLFFLLVISTLAYAQQETDSIAVLKKEFEGFKYKQVITGAQRLLEHINMLNENQIIEIYKLKGISHFTLSDDKGARNCFLQILNIDSSFAFDSSKTSPKIISFFNKLKVEYSKEIMREKLFGRIKTDTVFIIKNVPVKVPDDNLKQTMIRSILFPGLGQFYNNENVKGLILTSLGAAALASSIYFIIDSNKKKNDYLNATDINTINNKYNLYNTAYKMKNISLISFAAIWLYSQVDALFFRGKRKPNAIANLQISPGTYSLTINLPF